MKINQLFEQFPELETKRLILRAITHEDSHSLLKINNDCDVVEHINYGEKYNLDSIYETITKYYPYLYTTRKAIVWGMYEKISNRLIGLRMCFVDSFDEPVTIQGQIDSEYRRKGFTQEAYVEIIKLLRRVGVKKIKANCDKKNVKAIGLLKKMGFEKTFTGFNMDEFSPNPDAILFNKDLTFENTLLFNEDEIVNSTNIKELCELSVNCLSKNELGLAEEYINKALELEPSNPKLYLIKAKISKINKGNFWAISDYRKAIDLNENLAEAYTEIGICQYNIGMRSEALENWNKAKLLGDLRASELIIKHVPQN